MLGQRDQCEWVDGREVRNVNYKFSIREFWEDRI